MGYITALNELISNGVDKESAIEILDQRALDKIFHDEDEEYLKQEEVTEDDEDEEVSNCIDDSVINFEYDDDEEDELSFEDDYSFVDEEEF